MRERLIASGQIFTYEQWYAIVGDIYFCGLKTTDPKADYEEYVVEELAKW